MMSESYFITDFPPKKMLGYEAEHSNLISCYLMIIMHKSNGTGNKDSK